MRAGKTTVLIYNGGTEQRGPHAVLGGHTLIARRASVEIARRLGNALVAPVLFHRLGFVEYPLALVAACLLRPAASRLQLRGADFIAPLLLGLCVAVLVLWVSQRH